MHHSPDKSEILEQIHTMNPSDPDDIALVKRQIAYHNTAISAIQDEADSLLQQLRRLRFKQLEHQEAVNLYRGTITLARRLPHEILASIFEMCVRDGWTRTPLIVSHVCSSWRAAASPTIWSHVYVNLDARDPYGRTLYWITKSQSVLLDVSLEIHSDASCLPRVVDLLINHSARWRSLTVMSSVIAHANAVLSQCTGPFPHLSALNISISEDLGEETMLPALSKFSNAPKLHTLALTQSALLHVGTFPSSLTTLSITLNDSELTEDVSVSSTNKLLNLLEGLAARLRNFSLAIPFGHKRKFVHDHDLARIIALSSLESMTLMGLSDLHVILACLHTPALSRLHLLSSHESQGVVDDVTGAALVQLVQRSNPPLQLLQLRDVDVPRQSFIDCFASLPKLKVLRLHDSEISNDVFEVLQGEQCYCPELSTLDLRWCGQVSGSTLVRLVQSRSRSSHCSPITSVSVINCSLVAEEDVLGLARVTSCRVVIDDSDEHCREF